MTQLEITHNICSDLQSVEPAEEILDFNVLRQWHHPLVIQLREHCRIDLAFAVTSSDLLLASIDLQGDVLSKGPGFLLYSLLDLLFDCLECEQIHQRIAVLHRQ